MKKYIWRLALVFCLALLGGQVWGQVNGDYQTRASGNWNSNNTWQVYNGGWVNCAAGDYPGVAAGAGTVTIRNGHNITLNVNPANAIGALTINNGNTATTLSIGSQSLSVTGATTISSNNNVNKSIDVGNGSYSTASIALTGGNNDTRDAFILISGTGFVDVSGDITMNSVALRTYILFTGTGTLYVGGTITGGSITSTAGGGTNVPTSGTVNYDNAGTQTCGIYTYFNLTLSGSGAKTTTGATVNGILSMEGNATTSGTVATYGTNATLQYRGSALQTTGIEFPATFAGTGGVIIDNASGVNLGGSKVITYNLAFTSGPLSIGANTLTLNGTVSTTSGTLTGGATSNLIIGGNNTAAMTLPNLTSGLLNFTLNKTGTNNIVTLGGALTIGGVATFTAGQLNTANDITFNGTTVCGGSINATGGTATYSTTATNIISGTYYILVTPANVTTLCGSINITNNYTPNGVLNTTTDIGFSGTITCGTGSINATGGTITYSNATSNILPGSYNNLTLSSGVTATLCTGTATVTGTMALNGATLDIGSNSLTSATVTSTNTNSINISTGALTVNNNLLLASSDPITFSGAGALNVTGNLTCGTITGNAGTISIGGNFAPNAFDANTSTVNFNGTSGSQSVGAYTYNIVNFTGAATKNLAGDITVNSFCTVTSNLYCGGNVINDGGASTFNLQNGATLGIGHAEGITTSGATGNIRLDNRNYNTAANYIYNGGVAQVTGDGLPTTVNNLTVNNGSGLTLTNTGNLTISGDFLLTDGLFSVGNTNINSAGTSVCGSGTFSAVGSTYTLTGSGNTNFPAGTYNDVTINRTGGANVTICGNVTINSLLTLTAGNYVVGANTLTLNGATITGNPANLATSSSSDLLFGGNASGIILPSSVTALNNLTITNANGISLSGSPVLSGTLALNGGNLSLGNFNFTIAGNITTSGSFDNSHMIINDGSGILIKTGTIQSDYQMTYPVGTGTNYTPMVISGITAPAYIGNIGVRAVAGRNPNVPLANSALLKYWDVSSTLSPTNTAVGFYYDPAEVVSTENLLVVKTWNGSAFIDPLNPISGANPFGTSGTSTTLAGQWTEYEPAPNTTLYTYQSGNFNGANIWTTDPSGTTIVGSRTPIPGDHIVILNGRTITNDVTLATTLASTQIDLGGVLDMGSTSLLNLGPVSGQGKLKLSAATIPGSLMAGFTGTNGGTVEFYDFGGAGTNLPAQYTYNNLIISNSTASNNTLIFNNPSAPTIYTLNGNLTLSKTGTGTLTFTIGTASANRVDLTVNGNFTASAGSSFRIGAGNVIHNITFKGNFTNNGTVTLSNSAQYTAANNGAALVTFSGNSNNTLDCNNTTNFYRFILNKGADATTYTLTASSTNAAYFNLYGPITNTGGDYSTLALVLQNGTLKLKSSINIPALGHNTNNAGTTGIQEFHIPYTSCLWVDGATVSSALGSGAWRGTTIFGILRVSNGSFTNPDGTGGLTFFGNLTQPGQVIIEGGVINSTQFKQANANGRIGYYQSGGQFRITGSADSRNASAVFALPGADFSFTMTGGLLYINAVNITATNGIDIRCKVGNYDVTGGTVEILRPNLDNDQANFQIYSTVPFYNLNIRDTTYAGSNITTILQYPLTILNNFTISSATSNRTFNAAGFNVTVGGNFTVGSGGTYNSGANTTTLNGTGNNTFTIDGTINNGAAGLNNLVINKQAGSISVSGSQASLIVQGILDITSGTLADGGKTIGVNGNITNSGTHTGAGKIQLNGTNTQTIGGSGSGIFQNLELNNTNLAAAPVSLIASTTVNGVLTFSQDKLLNIQNYNLKLDESASFSGINLNRYVRTSGLAGDGGITKVYSLTSPAFTFPVGVLNYTPASITVNGTADNYGSITINPVDYEHPVTTNNNRSLTYYWKVKSSGFTLGSANISHSYTYADGDIVAGGDVSEDGYIAARYNSATYTWTKGTVDDVDESNNIIGEPGTGNFLENVSFIDGDYTAGDDNPTDPFGAPTIFYSRANADWNLNTTWSNTSHTVGVATGTPGINDIVIIGNNNTISCSANQNCASLQIEAGSTLDINVNTGSVFGMVLSHPTGNNGLFRLTTTITPSVNTPKLFSFPANSDFSDFNNNSGTTEYYDIDGRNGALYILPSNVTSYGNLVLRAFNGDNIVLPNNAYTTIKGNLTFTGNTSGAWIAMSWNTQIAPYNSGLYNPTVEKTIYVTGNLNIDAGTFVWMPEAVPQHMIVDGNVTVASGAAIDIILPQYGVPTGAAQANTMAIGGTLTNNSTASPYVRFLNGTYYCDLTFHGSNDAFITGTATSTIFNKVTVNKGNSQSTLLTLNVGGTLSTPVDNWLTLQNGTFKYMKAATLPVTTTSTFTIPSTACLHVEDPLAIVNIANTNVNNNDLFLNGKLKLVSGIVNIGNSANNNNNDIEYSAGGTSAIEVSGGALTVNGQIRRSSGNTTGVLKYTQTGGSVTINGQSRLTTRGNLEIANTGSIFDMSGNSSLTIVRGGGVSPFGDLYLAPASSSVSNSTIYVGNTNTPVSSTILINSTVPLGNLVVDATTQTKTAQLLINGLSLTGNLQINGNSVFNANGLNVNIAGNLTNSNPDNTVGLNNGGFRPATSGQLTTFNSSSGNQSITGTASNVTNFANLGINNTFLSGIVSLSASTNLTVNNDLSMLAGTLDDGGNTISVFGNVANSSIHASSGAGKIYLIGSALQTISGDNSGEFGNLEFNNLTASNPTILATANMRINGNLIFTNGLLDIQGYLLSLGNNTNIIGTFDDTKMIRTDGANSGTGVQKFFTSASPSGTFTFPVGTANKYTPYTVSTGSANVTGTNPYISVIPVNSQHLITTDPANTELTYYWHVETGNGFATSTFNQTFIYNQSDVIGTESNYVSAHLPTSAIAWVREGTIDHDNPSTGGTITFTNNTNINGDYTCGYTEEFGSIKQYHSVKNGAWTDLTTWEDENDIQPTVVPTGAIMTISVGHRVFLNPTDHLRNAYILHVRENAELYLDVTYGNNFLYVDGTGKISSHSTASDFSIFPAGDYTDFVAAGGGTFEFIGKGSLSNRSNYNNLNFRSEGGSIDIPAIDLNLQGNLTILSGNLSNIAYNRSISLSGNWTDNVINGFIPGTGRVIFDGIAAQNITINTSETFYDFEIDNASNLTLLSPVNVSNSLILSLGKIITDAANVLTLTNKNNNIVSNASNSSFVEGPLNKIVDNTVATSFTFPVGRTSRLGNVTISNFGNGTNTWQAEYFDTGYNTSDFTSPITFIHDEYWRVKGPVGDNAKVTLRWDALSNVSTDALERQLLTVAEWQTNWTQIASTVTDNVTTGTIITNSALALDEHLFTIGSTVLNDFVWTGATNTLWSIPGNWTKNGVSTTRYPSSNIDHVSISNTTNLPHVDLSGVCGNLTLNSGTLTVDGTKSLTIAGDFINNGTLTLKSPGDSNPTGSFILNGSLSGGGTTNVELFTTSNRWYYFVSPIATYLPSTLLGTGSINFYNFNETFDCSPDPSSGLWSNWNYPNSDLWRSWSKASAIRADSAYITYDDKVKVTTFSGIIKTNDLTVPVSLNANDGNAGVFDGWNLVGNSYASAIDWDNAAIDKSDIEGAIYFWDNVAQNYKYYLNSTQLNGATRYIPAMQGFMVKATATGTLTIPKSARLHSPQNIYKSGNQTDNDFMRIQITANGFTDETILRFHDKASKGYDPYFDAYKRFTTNDAVPQAYFNIGNETAIAINSLPRQEGDITIPLGIKVQAGNGYVIKANEMNFSQHFVYLEDKQTSEQVYLQQQPEYTFNFNGGVDISRFDLHFVKNRAPVISAHIQNTSVHEDSQLNYQIPIDAMIDPDVSLGDLISYTAKSADGNPLPAWLSFESFNRTFTGIPSNGNVGYMDVQVIATDSKGAYVSQIFQIEVLNVNNPPAVINKVPMQNATEDTNFAWSLPSNTFNDIDFDDKLTIAASLSDGSSLPAWLIFNTSNGEFSGTPANENVGTLSIQVTATDISGEAVSDIFVLEVLNVNDSPLLNGFIPDQVVDENQYYEYLFGQNLFSDMDLGDELSLSANLSDGSSLPAWLNFDPIDGRLSGTAAVEGVLTIVITATDKAGSSVFDDYLLTVNKALGFEDFGSAKVKVFPNPTKGLIFIETSTFTNNMKIFVRDHSGRTVKIQNVNSNNSELQLSGLADGVYFIELTDGIQSKVFKIILNK